MRLWIKTFRELTTEELYEILRTNSWRTASRTSR